MCEPDRLTSRSRSVLAQRVGGSCVTTAERLRPVRSSYVVARRLFDPTTRCSRCIRTNLGKMVVRLDAIPLDATLFQSFDDIAFHLGAN